MLSDLTAYLEVCDQRSFRHFISFLYLDTEKIGIVVTHSLDDSYCSSAMGAKGGIIHHLQSSTNIQMGQDESNSFLE